MRHPWRMVKAAYQVARTIRNPDRLKDILALAGVLVPPEALRRLTDTLWRIPSAAEALRERPRLGTVDLHALRTLPPGTLGRAFANHILDNCLDLSALPQLPAHTDAEYVRAHLLEVHDIWHVLTGFSTQVAGELGVQAFSLAQLGSPFAAGIITGGMANTLLFAFPERDVRMRAIVRGWLLGKRARLLFGGTWARMWERPLEEVRAEFELDVPGVDALLPGVAQSC
ncbi:MAG TPA: Coq4 family protein [Hyalangium sp.]|nr:Coq4 family protein [Hyalangium sp.]